MTQLLQPPVSCKAIPGSTLWVVPNVSSCLEGCHIVVVNARSAVLGATFVRTVRKTRTKLLECLEEVVYSWRDVLL